MAWDNKDGTGVRMIIYLPRTLYEAVCERARRESRTRSAVVRRALARSGIGPPLPD